MECILLIVVQGKPAAFGSKEENEGIGRRRLEMVAKI